MDGLSASQFGNQSMSFNPSTQTSSGSYVGNSMMPQQTSAALYNQAMVNFKTSGRSANFISSHMGQEVQMLKPNWGLNADQGNTAREMAISGRTTSQIRNTLGVGKDTYVPGKPG